MKWRICFWHGVSRDSFSTEEDPKKRKISADRALVLALRAVDGISETTDANGDVELWYEGSVDAFLSVYRDKVLIYPLSGIIAVTQHGSFGQR